MNRIFEGTLFGEPCRFLFSAGVLFDARDKYEMPIEEIMALKGREKLEALCYLATEMSKEAGSDRVYNPDAENGVSWQEAVALETAVLLAINQGTFREVKDTKPRSKTLEKIQKKTEPDKRGRTFLSRLFRGLGSLKNRPTTPPPA